LSYTSFTYGELKLSSKRIQAGAELEVEVSVKNSGPRAGEEVVQFYLSDIEASVTVPGRSLKDWKKISLSPGHSVKVAFKLGGLQMALVYERGKHVLEPGRFRVYVGGSQPDPVNSALGAPATVQGEFDVTR